MTRLFDRRLLLSVLPFALMAVVVITAIFGDHGLVRRHELRAKQAELDRRIDQLQVENERLRQEIRTLDAGPTGVQRLAAERLLLAPPGSTIYRFKAEQP